MPLAEPVTSGTDFLLAAVALILAVWRWRAPRTTPRWLWSLGLLLTAVAAAAGGVFHGWAPALSPALHRALWNMILVAIGAAAGLLAGAMISTPWGGQKWPSLLAGVGTSALALACQRTRLALGPVDHNGLFHLLEALAVWFFFRAGA